MVATSTFTISPRKMINVIIGPAAMMVLGTNLTASATIGWIRLIIRDAAPASFLFVFF